MVAILGKELSLVLDMGDGREYRLENGMITDIQIHNEVDSIPMFNMTVIGAPIQSTVSLSGYYTGAIDDLFAYDPDEEKIKAAGLIHGEHYCAYCGSDWLPDSRGNCGACGGDKHRGKVKE